MNARTVLTLTVLLMCTGLTACGPTQAAQAAAREAAIQKPTATSTPTSTATPTLTPTPTAMATATDTPTETPTITPTPKPDLADVILTADDLPAGFVPLTPEQIKMIEAGYLEGSRGFGFTLDAAQYEFIDGVVIPLPTRIDQEQFDQNMDALVSLTQQQLAFGANVTKPEEELTGLDEIGETRSGSTTVTESGGYSFHWDVAAFRRGTVGVLIVVGILDGDEPVVWITEIAQLLDGRIMEFVAANS